MIKISAIRDGMKRIDTQGKITSIDAKREVHSRYGDETYIVADATLSDETAIIKLTLWNEQIDFVKVGDNITIDNGYATSYRGETQLNIGKFGKLVKN